MTRQGAEPGPRPAGLRFIRLAAVVRQQREQITRIVGEAEAALADFAEREPPLLELRGVGAVVHDFYTGLEHVFERVASELDGGLPAGAAWHRELLESMALDLPGVRPPVLRSETAHALEEFLRFRHLFRNVYGFELEWPRLRSLLGQLSPTWTSVANDLERFLAFLGAAGSSE